MKELKKMGEKGSKTKKRLYKEGKLNQYKNLGEVRGGKNHPMYGKINKNKNKNYKELYGEEKSEKIIEKIKKERAKQILPVKDTKIEVKIQNFLKTLGIEFFTHQYMKQIKHSYQCDILIPYLNLVIECDGIYWHKYPIGNEIDHIRTKELIKKGFRVLRLWEFEIKEMNLDEFKNKLESFK